jgi:1-phosphofructokinase family hexose kinase
MVITVTLNPLVDKTFYVTKLVPGSNHRVKAGIDIVGGKGINVSRAVSNLGGKTVALSFIGGETGTYLSELLNQEGLSSILIRTKSSTRIQVSLLDKNNNKPTFFILPNEGVTFDELECLKFELTNILSERTGKIVLVISGSAPTGDMNSSVREIIHIANRFNILTILDSYGEAFKLGLAEKPFMVKQNRNEAGIYFGKSISGQDKMLDGLKRFIDIGIKFPIITSGKDPIYAGYNGTYWKIIPPSVKVVNPTGSGDAMTGSLALDLSTYNTKEQLSPIQVEKMLVKATAVGTVNALVWLPCGIIPQMVNELIPKVKIKRII